MRNNIVNLQLCTSAEKQEHIRYLRKTPVREVAEMLAMGVPLYKGVVSSREVLGSLPTIFGDLGINRCRDKYGREKFLVRELLPTLRGPGCNDKDSRDSLQKIEQYIKLDFEDSLEIKVTICERGANHMHMIVDGNKRASACYEGRSDQYFGAFPVYLVTC